MFITWVYSMMVKVFVFRVLFVSGCDGVLSVWLGFDWGLVV